MRRFALRETGPQVLNEWVLSDEGLLFRLDQPATTSFDEGIGDAGAKGSAISERLILNVSQHCRIFIRANQLAISDLGIRRG